MSWYGLCNFIFSLYIVYYTTTENFNNLIWARFFSLRLAPIKCILMVLDTKCCGHIKQLFCILNCFARLLFRFVRIQHFQSMSSWLFLLCLIQYVAAITLWIFFINTGIWIYLQATINIYLWWCVVLLKIKKCFEVDIL